MSGLFHDQIYKYFPNYFVSGAIFSKMRDAPWSITQAGLEMDILYFGSHSGIKPAASILNRFMDSEGVLDEQALADMLWTIYGNNWRRLWDAYMVQYDPINNYKVNEQIKRNLNGERTINKDGTDTTTNDLTYESTGNATSKQTGNVETTEDTSIEYGKKISDSTTVKYGKKVDTNQDTKSFTYGFNSQEAVPNALGQATGTESQSGEDTTTSTETQSGTDTNSLKGKQNSTIDNTANNTSKDTSKGTVTVQRKDGSTDKDIEDETITRIREGNIGQNTYQELLRQEFELWKWNFFRQVFSDCDQVLVLSVFGSFCNHIDSRFSQLN